MSSVLVSSYTSVFSMGEISRIDAHIINIHNPVAHLRSDTSDHPLGNKWGLQLLFALAMAKTGEKRSRNTDMINDLLLDWRKFGL